MAQKQSGCFQNYVQLVSKTSLKNYETAARYTHNNIFQLDFKRLLNGQASCKCQRLVIQNALTNERNNQCKLL